MDNFVLTWLGALIRALGTITGKILLSLGIGYTSFTGISSLIDGIKTDVIGKITSLDSTAVQLASVLQVGTCINILISAITIKLALKGLNSGVLTKMLVGATGGTSSAGGS